MTSSTSAIAKMSKPLINPPRRERVFPHHIPVRRWVTNAVSFVCQAAVPVQSAVVAAIGMERLSDLPDVRTANGCQMVIPPEEKGYLNSPCNKLIAICAARESTACKRIKSRRSNPPLQLTQHELADHVHSGV